MTYVDKRLNGTWERDAHEWGPYKIPWADAKTCVQCGTTVTNAEYASGRFVRECLKSA